MSACWWCSYTWGGAVRERSGRMERLWCPVLLGSLLVLGAVSQVAHGAGADDNVETLSDVVSLRDQARLEQVLSGAEPYDSVREAYLIGKGINAIGISERNAKLAKNACKYILAQNVKAVEDIYFVTSVGAFFKETCKVSSVAQWRPTISKLLKEATDTKTLYYATISAAHMKMMNEIDKKAVLAAIMEAVDSEDTPQSYAYAFLAASTIPEVDLSALFESIEDIVAQADETPSTLYFEGGLSVTSDVVNGIFALAKRVGSKPAITEAQATKFGNYLVTSKYTSSLEDAVYVLTAARTLSSNTYVVPVSLVMPSSQPISSSSPNFAVQLTTMMGGVVEGVTVKAKSLEDPEGEINPRTRVMTADKDKITFSYPMYKDTTGPGQYKVTVGTESKTPSPVVMLSAVELPVTVSFQVAVGSAQLSIVDKDQGVTTKSVNLEHPNTSKVTLEADQHSMVKMVFTLANKETSKPVTVHQAFVRLSLGTQEIFFVATPNAEKQYSFELDVADSAKDFGQLSGIYSLSLMVGDFALENPFSWDVASVELKFPGTATPTAENLMYKPKPLISHLFRVPEKRPSMAVSTAFTVLIFVPLVLLHIVWLFMGANFSNIASGGIWSILFQTGLGGILCLYYCFWAQLNMFTTLKYLVVIGGFTFLTGNRMLRNIARAKQS